MSKNYKYTNEITVDGVDNKTCIGPNDVVLLNGKNIVHSVENGDAYDGINPIPSFDFIREISAATSADIADIRGKYFKLVGNNVVTGSNTFDAKQTFSDIDATNLSIENGLSADFSIVLNTKSGKISSLHKDDEVTTINSIYRMTDSIIVEAGLKYVIGQYKELYRVSLDTLISRYIKGIILNKQVELSSSQIVQVFSTNSNPSVDECVEVLQVMADLLDIAPYSLDDKIQSVEESIDALDVNTQLNIVELADKIDRNTDDISDINRKINEASNAALLTSDTATSVITNFIQSNGRVTLSAKQLLSSDVGKLDGFVNDKIGSVKADIASHYLPLSGGNVTGALLVDSLSVKDSIENIKVGNSELCALLKNEFTALSDGTVTNIGDSLTFKYDIVENKIKLSIAGEESDIDASRFTEAKMLDRVEINTGTGAPVLWLYFKVENGIDEVSVSLSSITRLYGPGNGIDVQLDHGHYTISADDTICRRDDISALDCTDRFEGHNNRIITKLKQENGLISYATANLQTSNVIGLEGYNGLTQFVGSLSGNNGVISVLSNNVNNKFIGLQVDSKDFKTTDGKINVLTSLSQAAGKISYNVKPLAYAEIDGLSDAINSKLGNNGDQTLNGNLSVAKSLEIGGGKDASSGGCGATVIGRNAVAKDEESFVWNGNAISADEYYSHGQHTFNINPQNGIGGFYIGDKALSSTLSALSVDTVNTANIQLLTTINKALDDAGITAKKQSEITFENVTAYLFNLSKNIATILGNSTTTDKDEEEKKILHFTTLENEGASIALNAVGNPNTINLEYKVNNGEWSSWDRSAVSLQKDDMMYIRAVDENKTFSKQFNGYYHFSMTGGKVAMGGSVQYLLKKDGNANSVLEFGFYGLFLDCSNLTQAPELPATTLADSCYKNMFTGCSNLTQAPELPATILADSCYYSMFSECFSLTQAPKLPATTLANNCYGAMFQGCSYNLTQAPELPATILADYCYSNMFSGCYNLTQAPELPAVILAKSCYESMFRSCALFSEVHMPASMDGVYNTSTYGNIYKTVIYDL